MGMVKGDKARYNRERRKKLARRVEMRALRAAEAAKSARPERAVRDHGEAAAHARSR
jgi:hypothetical protein